MFLRVLYKLKLIPQSWYEIVLISFKLNLNFKDKLEIKISNNINIKSKEESIVFVLNNVQLGSSKVHFTAFLSLVKLLLSSDENLKCVFFITREKEYVNKLLFHNDIDLNFKNNVIEYENQVKDFFSDIEIKRFKLVYYDSKCSSIKSYFEEIVNQILSFTPKYSIFYTGAPNDSIFIRSLLYTKVPVVIRNTQTRHVVKHFYDYFITQNIKIQEDDKKAIYFPLNFDVGSIINKSKSIPKDLDLFIKKFDRVIVSALSGRVLKLYNQLPQKYILDFEEIIHNTNTALIMVGMSDSEFQLYNSTDILSKLKFEGKLKCFGNIDFLPELLDKASLLIHHINYPGGGWTGRICVNKKTPIMCFEKSDISEYLNNCYGVYKINDIGIQNFMIDLNRVISDNNYLNQMADIQFETYNNLMTLNKKDYHSVILNKIKTRF